MKYIKIKSSTSTTSKSRSTSQYLGSCKIDVTTKPNTITDGNMSGNKNKFPFTSFKPKYLTCHGVSNHAFLCAHACVFQIVHAVRACVHGHTYTTQCGGSIGTRALTPNPPNFGWGRWPPRPPKGRRRGGKQRGFDSPRGGAGVESEGGLLSQREAKR